MTRKLIAKMVPAKNLTSQEIIQNMIFIIRGKKVMLDSDLANLYQVMTGRLNEQVKRNMKRFPDDFMFQLSREEFRNLMSQFAISNRGGRRKLPFAFTEQGVAMLSSVLNSERAIQVNIDIMRAFTRLREMIEVHKDLKKKVEEMEKKYDKQFLIVFKAIKELLEPSAAKKKSSIGFHG